MNDELAARVIRNTADSTTISFSSKSGLGDVVDLSDLVRHAEIIAAPWLHGLWASRDITAGIRTELGEGCFVRNEKSHIFRLLLHLIRHAGWALEQTGFIALSTHVDDCKAVIRVSHTGRRISTEHINRLVACFFGASGHVDEIGSVATTHAPVPIREASIRLEAAPGPVTTVTIALPYAVETRVEAVSDGE